MTQAFLVSQHLHEHIKELGIKDTDASRMYTGEFGLAPSLIVDSPLTRTQRTGIANQHDLAFVA